MLGVGWDIDDLSGADAGNALRAMKLHLALEDDERFGFALVNVGANAVLGVSAYLAQSPSTPRLTGRYQLTPLRPRALAKFSVARSHDPHTVELAHGTTR